MDDVQHIKSALSIRTVITGQTALSINPAGHLEHCPFCSHKDCFSIPKGQEFFKCHSCDRGGDVFAFLQQFHSIDFAEALRMGAGLANIQLDEPKKKTGRRLTDVDRCRIDGAEYCHSLTLANLDNSLHTRRGHTRETIRKMWLGEPDGNMWRHLQAKGHSEETMIASGLVKRVGANGHSRLLDFVGKGFGLFPHLDSRHERILHFTQKDYRDVPKEEKAKHQMPNDKRDDCWAYYNQGAFDRFEEIFTVEGENDCLQILNAGNFGVVAMIGQPSDKQIKWTASRGRGKHLYLWMDNDEAGEKYVRKICRALPAEMIVKVVVYGKPGDDPDSYLRAFEGDRKREVRRLQMESVDYIGWEIAQAARRATLEEKLAHLQAPGKDEKGNVFLLIGRQPAIQQDIYREKLLALGFSEKAITQQLDFSQELRKQVAAYSEEVGKPDPRILGGMIFKHLNTVGRVFTDSAGTVHLIYEHKRYTVDRNGPFCALMQNLTGLLFTEAPGPSVWEVIRNLAFSAGRQIDVSGWLHTDTVRGIIFLNLNGPNNTILKVSRERIEELQNGMNDDHVLLSSSPKILPMTFLPDADIQEGLAALQELLFDNLATKREQKYLILAWLISGLCPDMAPYQFLMKFSGYASSGKSTASKMITALVYGSEQLSDPSGAAAFSSAARNPILVIDNLEDRDLNRGMQKFLLLAATRGQKEKRAAGTDVGTIDESPRALINVTAIEPFTLSELVSRTVEVEFCRRNYGSDDFHESEVLEQLKKKRDLILSALIRFLQAEILPNLDQRKEYMTVLNKMFKGHAKDRTNAYLALLMVILSKLLKYIPYYGQEDLLYGLETGETTIYRAWIEEQNAAARETESESNAIAAYLDALVAEYLKLLRAKDVTPREVPGYSGPVFVLEHGDLGLKMFKTPAIPKCSVCHMSASECSCGGEVYLASDVEFECTSKALVIAFALIAKSQGRKPPFENASVFGARLRNDRSLLEKAGWTIVPHSGGHLGVYSRKVGGARFLKFKHRLVQ